MLTTNPTTSDDAAQLMRSVGLNLTRRVNRFGPAKQFENGRSLRAALDRHDVQAAGGKGLADAALAGLADKNARAVTFVESLQAAGQMAQPVGAFAQADLPLKRRAT